MALIASEELDPHEREERRARRQGRALSLVLGIVVGLLVIVVVIGMLDLTPTVGDTQRTVNRVDDTYNAGDCRSRSSARVNEALGEMVDAVSGLTVVAVRDDDKLTTAADEVEAASENWRREVDRHQALLDLPEDEFLEACAEG